MIKYSELQELCLSDLERLQGQVNALIQGKQVIALGKIKIGDKVRINHRKCRGLEYTVEKINRKTYILKNLIDGYKVKASLGLIEAI